jgi:hypothetical protein
MIYGQGYRFDHHGWIYVHIEGKPYERGFQHGYLVAPELQEILGSLDYLTYWKTGMRWEFFVTAAERLFVPHIDQEYLDEIRGVAAGALAAGVNVTWQEVLAWNGRTELLDYWWPKEKKAAPAGGGARSSGPGATPGAGTGNDHCSAFIATGTATGAPPGWYPGGRVGRIVMAHNSWDAFVDVQPFNVIIDLVPASGHRLFMQTAPGCIDSFTDFFITGAGLMGTETTIAGFASYDPDAAPEFFRVRKAMQYADNLDRFAQIMIDQNNGGYANGWLLGDVHSGEIMMFELGLRYHNVERKTDGYFAGFNAPQDPRIRNLECTDIVLTDIRDAIGARSVRMAQLMDQYHGRVDVESGKVIIADHYDVYLKRINPCSRTICSHCELDAREYQPGRPAPFEPRGAVDGKVTDSDLAGGMGFWARWGNSCGTPFDADRFLAEHIQWSHQKGCLRNRPSRSWTFFRAGMQAPPI